MREIRKKLQAHVPFRLLRTETMETVIKEGINPEIGFDCNVLDSMQKTWISEVAKRLSDAGRTVTFHAPFMDLRPGAIDPRIRKVTTDRLQQVFDLVPYFHPLTVVCHPSFDDGYYDSDTEAWLQNSIETWGYFLKLAEEMGTIISLENVYEAEPAPLIELFSAFTSSHLCFCFDTGHFNVFSHVPLDTWVEKLAHRLGQLHVHDNNGQTDEHFAIGEGNFPFLKFFAMLRERKLSPLVTLEAHSEDSLRQMIKNIEETNLLGGL